MTKIPGKIYQRDSYIGRIKPFMRTNTVKVMIGHRRVGKSYILYQLINLIRDEERDANIIYINKEDLEFEFITTYRATKDMPERLRNALPDIEELKKLL